MRKIILLLLCVFTVSWAVINSDNTFTFQGYLTDSSGTPVFGDRNLSFAIYDAKEGGTEVFKVSIPDGGYRKVTVYNGNYATKINLTDTELTLLNQMTDAWMQVWIGPANTTSPYGKDANKLVPRIQLTSVPYALKVRGITYYSDRDIVSANAIYGAVWN